jgi:hypothetical protein
LSNTEITGLLEDIEHVVEGELEQVNAEMAHQYDVGTRAWQPNVTEGWIASEVKQKKVQGDKVTLVFELENGEV